MNSEMARFLNNARERNICDGFRSRLDACQSKKQYFDVAMHAQGVPVLCRSMADGWGLSPKYIAEKFRSFVNGKYISEQNGYESEMYCLYKGDIKARTTLLAIVSSDVTVEVPARHICKIHAVDSIIRMFGDGECHVYTHGKCDVKSDGKVKLVMEDGSDE